VGSLVALGAMGVGPVLDSALERRLPPVTGPASEEGGLPASLPESWRPMLALPVVPLAPLAGAQIGGGCDLRRREAS
jgi:hypothetical protein